MKAVFERRHDITESISSFSFTPSQPFTFTAGQYINLTLTGHTEHGQPAQRWFTISSSPHHTEITVTTRIGEATNSAFKRGLIKLQPGDTVDISEPMGAFVLPKLLQTPLIFIAGGIGITPFHSMFEWLAHNKEFRSIHMLYSVDNENDIIFQDVFNEAKQHVTVVVNNPSTSWGGLRGPLTAEMIKGIEPLQNDSLFYISGPEPFVQSMQAQLLSTGTSNQNIVVDEFQGYTTL